MAKVEISAILDSACGPFPEIGRREFVAKEEFVSFLDLPAQHSGGFAGPKNPFRFVRGPKFSDVPALPTSP